MGRYVNGQFVAPNDLGTITINNFIQKTIDVTQEAQTLRERLRSQAGPYKQHFDEFEDGLGGGCRSIDLGLPHISSKFAFTGTRPVGGIMRSP